MSVHEWVLWEKMQRGPNLNRMVPPTTGRRLSDERVNHNFTHNFSLLMTTAAYFKIIGEADIKQTSQSLCAWKLSYHSQSSI